jgi:cell wall-associated NlpC family hydrolase
VRGKILLAGVAAVAVIGGSKGAFTAAGSSGPSAKVAAAVIAYAEKQLGKSYRWGGTGPDAFDCSGLAMKAYQAAGITIARRSQDQWATERHVSTPVPGDLVFFAGADGTPASPGHVGIVIGGGQMIEAYGTGFPVRVASYTDRNPVGFTNPASGGA